MAHPRGEAHVGEQAGPVVVVENVGVVGEVGDVQVVAAVVVVVSHRHPHVGLLEAQLVEGRARGVAHVLERAVAPVAIEVVGAGVVGHEQVEPAVVVEVEEGHPEAVEAAGVRHPGLPAHVGEGPVAVVVEEMVGGAPEAPGAAHDGLAPIFAVGSARSVRGAHRGAGGRRFGGGWLLTRLASGGRRRRQVLEVERDVAGDEQVQPAVAVVVPEGAAGGPASHGNARRLGHVGECPLSRVAVEAVRPEVRDVEVRPTVVVEVAHAHALAPPAVGHAGPGRHVGEGPVTVVVEEGSGRRLLLAPQRREGGAVHEVGVQPAVVVVVHEGDAGAGGLQDVVLGRAARHLPERRQAGDTRDIRVGDPRRSRARGPADREGWRDRSLERQEAQQGPGERY